MTDSTTPIAASPRVRPQRASLLGHDTENLVADRPYPAIESSQVPALLEAPYPILFLSPRGTVLGANLLGFFIWAALQPGDPVNPSHLLRANLFDIFARAFSRLPLPQNDEFYVKKTAVLKRLDPQNRSTVYASFRAAMHADSDRRRILLHANAMSDREWLSDREWRYHIHLLPPPNSPTTGPFRFHVTVFRLDTDTGFLAVYRPEPDSAALVSSVYHELRQLYGPHAYVQTVERLGSSDHPSYYPRLVLDLMWNVVEENQQARCLFARPTLGLNVLELFRQIGSRTGSGLVQDPAFRAMAAQFTRLTKSFRSKSHHLHSEYSHTRRTLAKSLHPQTLSAGSPTQIYALDHYALKFPCPLLPSLITRFTPLVLAENARGQDTTDRYDFILVPQRDLDRGVLILFDLAQSAATQPDSQWTYVRQLKWCAALLRTVTSGLIRAQEDVRWDPRCAFDAIRSEIYSRFDHRSSVTQDEIRSLLRKSVSDLMQLIETDQRGQFLELISKMCYTGDLKQEFETSKDDVFPGSRGREVLDRSQVSPEFTERERTDVDLAILRDVLVDATHNSWHGEIIAQIAEAAGGMSAANLEEVLRRRLVAAYQCAESDLTLDRDHVRDVMEYLTRSGIFKEEYGGVYRISSYASKYLRRTEHGYVLGFLRGERTLKTIASSAMGGSSPTR